MKKTSIFFAIATIALLSACRKENFNATESTPGAVTVIGVGINDVKTTMGAPVEGTRKIYWANGDKLQANTLTSDALADLPEECTSARFTFDGTLTYPANLLYPADYYKDESTITLPLEQPVTPKVALYGYMGEEGDAQMNALLAYVHIPLTQGEDKDEIKAMTVESLTDGYCLSGDFTIDYETGALTPVAGASKKVSVLFNKPLDPEKATDFFAAVPAGENVKLSVKFRDVKGHCMTKTVTRTFAAGKVVSLPDTEFVPTTTEFDVVITTAAQFVQFAKDYNDGKFNNPIVQLGGDIVFDETTSAEFVATGGIGTKDDGNGGTNHFNGVFDGNNHTISGLEATVPVFAYTGSHGDVKNLTLNDDCSFTFTHKNDAEGMFGAIVGYHKGTIDNVKVAADVSLADKTDVTNMTSLGGLVGYANGGVIQNGSEYSGLISTPDGFKSTKKLIIGGLAGRIKTSSSNITGSYFKGAISNAAEITSTDKNNPYLIIGGVVGFVDGGASVSSSNSTADHAAVAGAHSSSAGQIVNKTKIAYNSVVGGIVGENNSGTVSQCNNSALVFNSIFKTGADISRYMKTGGIVGKNNAEGVIDGCNNTEKIQHRSNPKMQEIAGIAGYNAGTVKNCSNSGDVNHMTTGVSGAANKGGRIVSIAGVIGENAKGAVVSNVSNTANIQISAMEDGTASEARMGGVIAYNLADIDGGESKSITNTGQVYFSPNFANQFLGYEFGGVVGYSEGSISNVKNSGYVYVYWNSDANVASKMCLGGIVGKIGGTSANVIGCVNEATSAANSGEVYFNFKSGALHYDNYAGGILGYTNANVIVSGCSNSGNIHNANYTAKSKPSYVGGIVGYLAGASELRECSNSGEVYNNMSNNDDTATGSAFCGGIVGYVKGANGNLISLSKCSNTSDKTHGRRGYVGGIVGYGEYMLLSNCTFNQSIVNGTVTSACRWLGGIAGWAVNSQITGCTFSGSTLQATQLSANTNSAGGIAAKIDACVVDGCYSHVTTINNASADVDGGAIVGRSGNGNTIQNCHYKDTVNNVASKIAASGTYTDGGGNVADL